MEATFTFLGSGTSRGVPMMCCQCPTCTSTDPRDCHDRSSALISAGNTNILIDCGPDFRHQFIRHHITRLDALLLTHPHADHLDGLDDLQGYTQYSRLPLPFYAKKDVIEIVHQRFSYVDELRFNPDGSRRWAVPQLDFRVVDKPFSIRGVPVIPLPIMHGRARIFGYRIGDMAYVSDCSHIPDETYPLLEGVTDLVIDALRWLPHPTHFCIPQANEEVLRIRPKRAWYTHLTHDVLYARDQPKMPPGITLAYDGLKFTFQIP